MTRRIAVFAGAKFYPTGGWGDYLGVFDDEYTALSFLASHHHDWWQIVDLDTLQIVRSGSHD